MSTHDVSDVGHGKTHGEPVEKYDSQAGKYTDNVSHAGSVEERLGTAAMPKAADPSPFTVGGASPSGRQ